MITYIKNEQLKTIKSDWPGNAFAKGRFIDLNKRFSGSFKKFLQWQLATKDKKLEKKADTWRLTVRKGNDFLRSNSNCIVWLGHATFFIRIHGVTLITDPIFGRISGVVPRLAEFPCSPDELRNIDYVLLSHAHRDHCDKASLQKIFANNPQAQLLTSLNTGKLVNAWIDDIHYQEAGWYQQYQIDEENLRITFLPVQHWSNRYLTDINKTLYGSFMIEADGVNIFFNGDSGYCSYPKQIGELFPNIDIAIVGVGAYHPPLMMKDVHTNPFEAVQIFHDLKAKTLIPMHYGTFDLADEPLGEPVRILRTLQSENKINGTLALLDAGEVMHL